MAYGLQLFNSSGAKFFDSTTAMGGVVVDIITASSAVQTKTYPAFPGRTAFTTVISGIGTDTTTDTTLGYPRVYFPAYYRAAYPNIWMVFIL